jgi:lysophospholipase L1-like esterase
MKFRNPILSTACVWFSVPRALFLACSLTVAASSVTSAQPQLSFNSDTRYVALGDSVSAGWGAMPATQGFPYQLYQSGVIDNLPFTLFCNMAVPGALSQDVLDHQVPQVKRFLNNTGTPYRKVITLQIGGNDLAAILTGADPTRVLTGIGTNHLLILKTLTAQFPDATIYVANFYDPKLPIPGEKDLILAFNQVIAWAVGQFPSTSVLLVDVYSAFEGRTGLLLNERNGADKFMADLTNAGQEVYAGVFTRAIRAR